MEIVLYNGWSNCLRLSNPLVDLIIPLEIGLRVMRYGFIGEENELFEIAEDQGKTGGDTFRYYGGHRLWHAPEANPRTYHPDNEPVSAQDYGTFVRLIQPVENSTGIQKEIDIALSEVSTHVRLVQRLRNTTLWTLPLAPWGLTMMAAGGTAILPMPPRGSHPENLTPVNSLALWAYTDLSDTRLIFGRQNVLVRQDTQMVLPLKIGARIPSGWAGYARRGHLLIKRFHDDGLGDYPDLGSNVEIFTNADMLEVETLGPMQTLPPGGEVEHVEDWYLFRDVPTPHNDTQVERHILPKILETDV